MIQLIMLGGMESAHSFLSNQTLSYSQTTEFLHLQSLVSTREASQGGRGLLTILVSHQTDWGLAYTILLASRTQ